MRIRPQEFFYIANLLSISRVILVLPVGYFIKINTPSGNIWLIGLTLVAIATDFLDGYLSRRLNQVTDLGKILDPIADKIAMAAVMILLIYYRGFPYQVVLLLLYRDVMILLVGAFTLSKTESPVMANFLGKLNTTLVSFAIVLYMLNFTGEFFRIILYLSYVSIIVSGASYFTVGEQLLFPRPPGKYFFRLGMAALTLAVLYLIFFS